MSFMFPDQSPSGRSFLLNISLWTGAACIAAQPLSLPLIFYFPLILWGGFCLTCGKNGCLVFLLLLLLLVMSTIQYRDRTGISLPFPSGSITALEGVLVQEPSWNERGDMNLVLDLIAAEGKDKRSGEGAGQISVFLPGKKTGTGQRWMRGDRIIVSGRMIPAGEGRERPFFYARRLERYSRIRPDLMRTAVMNRVADVSLSVGGLSEILLPALVLGLKNPDQSSLDALFRETGTAHIIALSGFHSGLVALLIFALFRYPFGYRPALVLAGGGLLVYLYLAGVKPSLLRAVVMFLLIVFLRISRRKAEMKKVLLLSYLLTGLLMPESLHTLSARLSYLALWGILHTGPLFNAALKPKTGPFLAAGLSASLAAQLWTLPLVLKTFGLWYPSGIPASLVLTPLITLYMYGGIFLLLFHGIPGITFIMVRFCRTLVHLLTVSAGLFGKIPHLCAEEVRPGLFLILLFPLLLGAVYRPGGFHGQRKSESELRFHFRNKGSSGSDGSGTEEKVGAELPDQQGCQGKDHQSPGSAGG